ncbi:TMhelix containing protein [Vibrio phage 1.090.B._10N.286.48.F1]|nr:TMhelix containing protein [Vibrio phage 1.090.B._10N.286.48.F1]
MDWEKLDVGWVLLAFYLLSGLIALISLWLDGLFK